MDIYGEFIHLARLALSGRRDDVHALLRRTAQRAGSERPDFRDQLTSLVKRSPDGSSPYRRAPVEQDSRRGRNAEAFLLPSSAPITQPTWAPEVGEALDTIIAERGKLEALRKAGVQPTRSLLFVGPPGVGKTLAAHWLAEQLSRDLFTVDLASIMSSYLGRTGANLRAVLSEASGPESILFVDEFDSLAKRRSDDADIGELKRLVNVLLQSIDYWPNDGLLIAATNHPELLDRAVWRRFDKVLRFPMPDESEIRAFLDYRVSQTEADVSDDALRVLVAALVGRSFADIHLWLNECIRAAVVNNVDLNQVLSEQLPRLYKDAPISEKTRLAVNLVGAGMSQRKAAELIGISRDTIRKRTKHERA